MLNFLISQCTQCPPEISKGFFEVLLGYIIEVGPVLILGFLLSGIINEFVPEEWIEKNLGGNGIKPILFATLMGSILPLCCWGSLPVAVSIQKKGAGLGPIIAFLVATPATSISAFLVTWSVLGIRFALFIFVSVIIMGVIMGIMGNLFTIPKEFSDAKPECHCCEDEKKKSFTRHIRSILKFAFVDMIKDIGLETLIGLVFAAVVVSFAPVGSLVNRYLSGYIGFLFAITFGILMYICATSTPPLVDAFLTRGMMPGAGMALLLIGPITSYGTLLVLNKKFGLRVLVLYLIMLTILSFTLGNIYQFFVD